MLEKLKEEKKGAKSLKRKTNDFKKKKKATFSQKRASFQVQAEFTRLPLLLFVVRISGSNFQVLSG